MIGNLYRLVNIFPLHQNNVKLEMKIKIIAFIIEVFVMFRACYTNCLA